MGKLTNYSITIDTTGTAGSAAGSGTTGVMSGILRQIHVDFHSSAPSTSDTTIAFATPAVGNVLVLTNTNTDGVYRPRLRAVDNTSSTANVDLVDFYLNGALTVTLAQFDALTKAVSIVFVVEATS